MKIRNIIIFILLIVGIYFLYTFKEGLTVQEAQQALNDAKYELAKTDPMITSKLGTVNDVRSDIEFAIDTNSTPPVIKRFIPDLIDASKRLQSSTDTVPNLSEKVVLAQQALDSAIYQANLENRTVEVNKLVDIQKKEGQVLLERAVQNQQNADKGKYDNYIQENQSYFESLTNKAKNIITSQLNKIAALKKQAIDNNFFINEPPKIKTTKTTKDKYADPECEHDEFIYCSGDKITCEDIFGNPVDSMIEKNNGDGKTFSGCGSGLKATTYEKFLDDMTVGLTVEGQQSVFYDISLCPSDKPWRVDIYEGDLSFNIPWRVDISGDLSFNFDNDLSGVYIKNNYECYKNPTVASGISKLSSKDTKNLYIDSVVYVDGDYMYDKYKDERVFKLIREQSKIWVNNKVCYKGIIKDITKNNTFNVFIPDSGGELFSDISSKYLYTINLEYSSNLNNTLTDLKVGSMPRPVCKNGNFTNKCSKKQPSYIEKLQKPNKTAYSADAFPLLFSEGNEETGVRKLNFTPYSV